MVALGPGGRITRSDVVAKLKYGEVRKLLTLPSSGPRSLLGSAPDQGISGGSVYDALIAATVKHADATLLTRDRRAASTYEAVGVAFRMLD